MNKSQLIKLTEDIKSNKNFRAGWRYFECDDCGSCYNFVFPHDYILDKSGNLI